ncbi:uncharacterized protein LOC143265294 [Megachile rotundata]|uniref:uncharacterized protein LOC143265294 n=1 Tax=Megachile rotundata TaxID=143995 RepID=UPI003FD4801C
MSKEFTMNELKKYLRARNLPVSGSKSELILRLEEFDRNIWDILAAERVAREEELKRIEEKENMQSLQADRERLSESGAQEIENMRRECDLLRRELELLRREQLLRARAMASPMGVESVTGGTNRNALSANMSIRAIGDLLIDFDGCDGTFWKWEQQLRLLRETYELDDKATRILVSSKLKGRAASWFHSKPDHLVLNIDSLLKEMKSMFDHRPSKLFLRREFERRVWTAEENFSDYYYHDKIILGNRVPIPAEELVDYSIDGITDSRLQNQARMMRFRSTEESLEAFEKITLNSREFNFSERKNKVNPDFEEKLPLQKKMDCPKRLSNQPSGSSARKEGSSVRKEPGAASSTNVVQPVLPAPYLLTITFDIFVKNNQSCKYTLSAMLDSGSPISFIKNSLVPKEIRTPLPDEMYEFVGINGSRMEILGLFDREVKVEGIPVKIKFFVVPDKTMTFMAILGRDFSSNPSIKLSFDNGFVVSRKESDFENDFDSAVAQILNIDCVNEPVTMLENLQINSENDSAVVEQIKESYRLDYLQVKESSISIVDFEMNIVLKHDQPISFRPRRLSYADKEKLQKILDDLLNRDNFPSQLIEDNLDQLKNKCYYTTLDLKDGYYNVRMAEQAIKFTSFVTPLGQFEFLFCPFGLTNAPKVFARFVQKIFCDLIRAKKVLVYFDDFMIATETLEEHLEILREVFRTAAKSRLPFKLNKCAFAQFEVDYLGYHVSFEGIRPSDSNIEAVLNYPIPHNSKDVLRFVSLASYFRRFIPGFSIIAKPLYDLVKKEAKFVLGEKEHSTFEMLKKQLANKPILSIYSPTAETELHCDASALGFGAILLQKQADKCLKPIAYFSQRTTPTEAKYHSFELECLAVVNAIKRFRIYLSGIHFKIITDCDSFRLTLSKQTINPRISRWALYLQEFDYEIQHRPGNKMSHVDALSRCSSILVIQGNSFEQTLSLCQDKDPEIGKIRELLEKSEMKHFELRDGLVYRKNKMKKLLFYVPRLMEDKVIRSCHDDLGHVGQDKFFDPLAFKWSPIPQGGGRQQWHSWSIKITHGPTYPQNFKVLPPTEHKEMAKESGALILASSVDLFILCLLRPKFMKEMLNRSELLEKLTEISEECSNVESDATILNYHLKMKRIIFKVKQLTLKIAMKSRSPMMKMKVSSMCCLAHVYSKEINLLNNIWK